MPVLRSASSERQPQWFSGLLIHLTSGSIVSSGAHDMALSNDASGVINFVDGSKIDFVEIEHVHW